MAEKGIIQLEQILIECVREWVENEDKMVWASEKNRGRKFT